MEKGLNFKIALFIMIEMQKGRIIQLKIMP